MNKKHDAQLSAEDRGYVEHVLHSSGTPKTVRKRAQILLMADSSLGKPPTHKEIAARCGTSDVTVWKTIKEFCEEGVAVALRKKQSARAGKPDMVTGEVAARIIAVACGEPPEGFTRWTVRMLTERVIELKIVESISRETVRTVLKKGT